MSNLLNNLDELPLSQAVAKGLRIADAVSDTEIVNWCRLELAGYWASNSAMNEQTVVPEYREVVGQHADIYGRPLILKPELSFINKTRLRNGIEELEALARTRDTVMIHDSHMCELIQQHLKIEVYSFHFSAIMLTGIFSAIREELRQKLTKLEPRAIALQEQAKGAPTADREVLELKPNLWGIGIDLRALWNRFKGPR